MPADAKEFHLSIDANNASQKVSQLLADTSGLSQQQIKQAMQKGAVWLENQYGTHRIRRASTALKPNSTVHFYYSPTVLAIEPPTPELIADEQAYSVWHKPTGMLSQGSKWSDHCTINRWIESHYRFGTQPQRNCFIVHRLDKAANGLILIAHSKKVTTALARLFETRALDKRYHVIVEGEFPSDIHNIHSPIDNKVAHSIAKRIDYCQIQNRSLVEVTIKTGRKHQIRQHMKRAGHPVVGDRLHGNANSESPDLQLQAFKLSFYCPISLTDKHYQCPTSLQLHL